MTAPQIDNSTKEQREQFIIERFACKNDCDNCGNCALLHNQVAEKVYADYISGLRSFEEITMEIRY